MTDPLDMTPLFRASFPLLRYFLHRSTGSELLFGADCFLLNRKHEIPCPAIPDFVAYYGRTPLGLYLAPGEFRITNLLLNKPVNGGESVHASRLRECQSRIFFESDSRLYELAFMGPVAYPVQAARFVSESPSEMEHWLTGKHGPDAVVLDSGIAVRMDGSNMVITRDEQSRIIENALPAGTRLYTDGEKVLILDGSTLKSVKTRKE